MLQRSPAAPDGAVADQFRIESAVVRKVDLLGHQSIQHGTDPGRGAIHLDGKRWRLGGQAQGQRKDGHNNESEISFTHSQARLVETAGFRQAGIRFPRQASSTTIASVCA